MNWKSFQIILQYTFWLLFPALPASPHQTLADFIFLFHLKKYGQSRKGETVPSDGDFQELGYIEWRQIANDPQVRWGTVSSSHGRCVKNKV